jgi:diguanylate cyclase (GGDEF)-like protein
MEVINFLISLVILIAVYAGALVIIYYERQKNEASIKKELERYRLQLELLKDNLTSLYNRAALQEQLQVMEKSSDSFVFVMIDVDDFKQINDTMGHVSGDTVLKKMADVLTKYSKDHPAFRFGGDEFCILFKNETAEQAVEICRKIQAELKRITDLEGIGGVTASFGIACYEEGLPAESLVEHADKALYESKKNKGSITIYEKAMGGDIG